MPFETLIDDEMLVMDELLEESGKTLKTHQIEVPLGSIMNQVPSVQSGASLQRWALQTNFGSNRGASASSIKALNLEPMRGPPMRD